MKIFGKRKSSTAKPASTSTDPTTKPNDQPTHETAPPVPQKDENVASYFSNATADDGPKKKKAKSETINGEEMEKLLAMDYEALNSKQRRLVRRFRERDGGAEADKSPEENHLDTDEKQTVQPVKESEPNNKPPTSEKEQELLDRLSKLNSKDRRKFLRRLRGDSDNDNVDLDKLEEEAKKIARQNIQEATAPTNKPEPKKQQTAEPSKPPKSKSKDLSHLSPEEIARRAKQRLLQIEAASLRGRLADGTATPEEVAASASHKHPLNSERRRANRRKPARKKSYGKSGGGGKGEFNEVGYRMRRG